ncbi:AarF/ABC1/UbiB kinase family protein [Acinetobacter sp. MD2(2019)]|uniref:ABC1 kinase family protein n=1 Tax=Acinetobacter sp. MD2(2019) TaxID=2605273 RepID=UPI002D1F5F06|nr:AarF/ABC1/UbiB kinase family protein [Acinetobacter sp. MD2(2019)]MEB3753565.1 AarF/ABC1/UbiB kinase family protein [Acinetobacter sp. MD2(2019)]
MAKSASTPTRRFLKLAGMTATIASKTITHSIRNIKADDQAKTSAKSQLFQEIGIQIADTLGEMKGAVMKVGQIASQYKDLFPKEVSNAIAKLQRQAPAMPFSDIQKQVESALGKPLTHIFSDFEPEPFAAASIGQVHRATLHTGQQVVVKVQYPGVDEACASDLKQVRLALRMMGLLKIDKTLQDKLFAEIQDSLDNELNYQIEAHNLEIARNFHQAIDSKIIIPQVFHEYSSRHILTLSLEMGESIETASTWALPIRNQLGRRLIQAIGQEIFYLKRFHCDPHPGNFAFREDGSVIIYDYGSIKQLSEQTVEHYRALVNAARESNIPQLEQHLKQLEVIEETGKFPEMLYKQWLEVLLRPLTTQYNFEENSSHHDAMILAKQSLKYWDVFKPSAETLMINRTVSGHYWNLIHLKMQDDLSDLLSDLVPKPTV